MEFAARFTHASNPRLTATRGYTQHATPRESMRASNLRDRPGIRREGVTRTHDPLGGCVLRVTPRGRADTMSAEVMPCQS